MFSARAELTRTQINIHQAHFSILASYFQIRINVSQVIFLKVFTELPEDFKASFIKNACLSG
jgi:hypothetical protein